MSGRSGGKIRRYGGAGFRYIQTACLPSPILPLPHLSGNQVIANKPIQDGDRVIIEYDFNDKVYLYCLYHLPAGA